MNKLLLELSDKLQHRTGEIYIEVSRGSEKFGSICGRRMTSHEPLSLQQADAYIRAIKQQAGLSASDPPVPQSGTVQIGSRWYNVTCCPQFRGEILILT